MKQQTWIILTLIFALIIAIFAVINVDAVEVDFLFVQTEAPLILVILFSALLGCLAVASVGLSKSYQTSRELKQLRKENEALKQKQQEDTSTLSKGHSEKGKEKDGMSSDLANNQLGSEDPLVKKESVDETPKDRN